MKRKIVIGFFLLLLINFSLELSINSHSLPESQDNVREWTLLNNQNNTVNIEVLDSRNISINYYIEEIEEIDQMRYIVNLNFTGETQLIYGNVTEDLVRMFTIFYVTVFAGDETNLYFELQILNETIFTIPNYFYNFSWNFTSKDPLQFLNLRFHKMIQEISYFHAIGGKSWDLIQDTQNVKVDNFNDVSGKINFNINSQQFITNFNISVDFCRENHTKISLMHDIINQGDGSVGNTNLYGSLYYSYRVQNIIDNGWIPEISYSYSNFYLLRIPDHDIFGFNSQDSLLITSNDEMSNQTDKLIFYLTIEAPLKFNSPLHEFIEYCQSSVCESLSFELDNIDSSQEFFTKYSRIFKFVGVILGITSLVILTKLYQKRRNLR